MLLFVQQLELGEHYGKLLMIAIDYCADSNYTHNIGRHGVDDDYYLNGMYIVGPIPQEHCDYAMDAAVVHWMV